MTLPTTNLAMSAIQTEFGGSNPISLSEYYEGGSNVKTGSSAPNGPIPTSGQISMGVFRGAAQLPYTLQYLVIAGGASGGVGRGGLCI
jgi:hypothetical protein